MKKRIPLTAAAIALLAIASNAPAAPIAVTNAGFEDVTGQFPFFEFTFGVPAGWALHDPNTIVATPNIYTGTLEPNGTVFFNTTAPEGDKVAILFNSGLEGDGEYGFAQTLTDTLLPNTQYTLTIEVGNIASGTADDSTFYNLDEFPGYRIDLLAGGVAIAQDINTLVIPEGEFATATVQFTTGGTHPQLGLPLGIRLVNRNVIPGGYTQLTSPDLEVDFDDVRLDATAVIPEPASLSLLTLGAAMLLRRRAARRTR